MAKYVHLEENYSYHFVLIGIASDERIWKVCHEINRLLSINLKNVEQPSLSIFPSSPTKAQSEENKPDLFDGNVSNYQKQGSYYEDFFSESAFSYSFFEPNPTISLKKVRPFRYFLLIRAEERSILRIGKLLQMLNTSTSIRSAVDISDATNINEIIH